MKRFGVIFILFLTFAGFAFTPKAQAIQPTNDVEKFIETVDQKSTANSTSKEWYTTDTVGSLQAALVAYTMGGSNNPESAFYYGKSPLAMMGNVMGAMYANPPADLALWIQDTGQSLGFIPKQAYAQGIGFTGFSALLPLWKAFRNIAYALLALIMIIIGFMVMFRRKIDPKTVVTVQNALPKIVLTLLLITFSYAIVGLMIDLMYFVILLLVGLVNSTGLLPSSPGTIPQALGYKNIADVMSRGGMFTVWQTLFPPPFSLTKLSADLIGYNIGWAVAGVVIGALGFLINPVVGLASAAAVIGAPIIVQVIIAIALLFAFIRLIVLFIGSYIQIVLALIIGPIQIMTEAIPGVNGFSSWLKNLFSNIIVFPVAAGMFLLSIAFQTAANKYSGNVWTPPFAMLPGAGVSSISAIFSIGVLLIIPNIVGSIKEAIKTKPIVSGPSIGEGANSAMQLVQTGFYIRSIAPGVWNRFFPDPKDPAKPKTD